ncbi:MAG: GDP-mannose 4,6-dehydratase [Carnobacterium sp.]|uniref:RmlD substrate binding domain protein n=1 Tax=Carnobacterium maltaromaticum LMA28 TaxID=1234679 RepID=K8E178_CARML|nr:MULTISPECIES: NAD-dependent epimerase/dehydratase family protein [Carnobacterium]MBC9787781.1 NAD-dependent epimerase/dehydratase family protein [Carnobacterium maltaromaticum]MBQ6484188.1 GDP-mannose 4,6-dehydratase [Carnobacterium sp.]MCC4311240.1 epimerase [Carnobacterium maltaromaticum]CAD5899413.1 RmlD substrate binding domain protein [Carnobacterium maltaromaticum]CCO09502.2 rmlD substrate binding domain protein [Carnobacterium maltaromaticum LMA28]
MNKILITGGAGFIGSHLVDQLIETHQIWVIDNLSMGVMANLPNHKNLTFIYGDICDKALLSKLLCSHKFDYIFHLAAIANVQDSVMEPIKTHQVNFEATLTLLDLIKKEQPTLKRLVFASSAAVYGDLEELPKKESSSVLPKTPYAIDKYAAERFVLSYFSLYNVPTSAVRFFNVYGPRQNPTSTYSGVISIITNKLKNNKEKKETFTVYGTGQQTRDFIYVKDVVQSLILVSKSEKSLGEVYNIGSGEQISLNRLIKTYTSLTGLSLNLTFETKRDGDIQDSYASITKLKSLGFKQTIDLKTGLNEYWQATFQK